MSIDSDQQLKSLLPGEHQFMLVDDGTGIADLKDTLARLGGDARATNSHALSHFRTGSKLVLSKLCPSGDLVLCTRTADQAAQIFRRGARLDRMFSEVYGGPGVSKNVSLELDLQSGTVIDYAGTDDAEEAGHQRSLACFGHPTSQRKGRDLGFPMADVDEAKLCALFGPLRAPGAHGTVQRFPTRVMRPTVCGRGIEILAESRAEGDLYISVAEHAAKWWWLPPSAQLPWAAQLPGDLGERIDQRPPFKLSVRGPAGVTEVDWSQCGWEKVKQHASPAMEIPLIVGDTKHKLLVQISYCDDPDDELQKDVVGKVLLFKGGRFIGTEEMPYAFRAKSYIDIDRSGPANFHNAHEDLSVNLYGGPGAFPIAKGEMQFLTKRNLHSLLGREAVILCSCHTFAFGEGKESLKAEGPYPTCMATLYRAMTEWVMAHHPEVVEDMGRAAPTASPPPPAATSSSTLARWALPSACARCELVIGAQGGWTHREADEGLLVCLAAQLVHHVLRIALALEEL